MSANCKSCGRIMTKPEDYSGGDIESQYCSSCTNADGSLKSLDEITLHIANQLIMSQGIDREAATKAARSILSVQPEWKTFLSRFEKRKISKTRFLIIILSSMLLLSMITITLLVVGINQKIIFSFTRERVDYYEFTGNNMLQKTRIVKFGDQFDPYIDFGRYMIASYNDNPNELMYAEYLDTKSQNRAYVSIFRYPTAKQIRQIVTPRNTKYKNLFAIVDFNNQVKLISINDNKEKLVALPIDEKDVVCVGNLVVWIEINKLYPQYNTVMSLNVNDGKISPIDDSATEKMCIKSYDNKVFWIKTNPKKNSTTIEGYDIQTNIFIETNIEIKNSYFDAIVEGCGVALGKKEWFVGQDKIVYIERDQFSALTNNQDNRPTYRLHIYNYINNSNNEISIDNYTELNNSISFVTSVNQLIVKNSSIFGEYAAYRSGNGNMQGITVIDVNRINAKQLFIKTYKNASVIAIYDNWLFILIKKVNLNKIGLF